MLAFNSDAYQTIFDAITIKLLRFASGTPERSIIALRYSRRWINDSSGEASAAVLERTPHAHTRILMDRVTIDRCIAKASKQPRVTP